MELNPRPWRRVVYLIWNGRALFQEWLHGLKDQQGATAIRRRILRMQEGNFGDHRPVGEGVFEMRIHSGPGYRVYYAEKDLEVVLLICGGNKSTQNEDIRRAKELWAAHRRSP